jgi:Mrp family chromosome partitioning ATPase
MLASRGFSQIVTDLQKEADYVLVIGGPLSAPNAMAVALPTDGIVLTGHDGATTGADVEAALSRAQVLDIPVIGLVLVAHSR